MPGLRALFPLDGSEPTYEAVEAGLQTIAGMKGAKATFLVVMSKRLMEMPEDAREHLTEDDEDEHFLRKDEAQAVLDKALAIAKRLKFKNAEARTVLGEVYDAIMAEARKHDVLVMHRLDRVEYREKLRGGILERLARNADCDVWLVNTK